MALPAVFKAFAQTHSVRRVRLGEEASGAVPFVYSLDPSASSVALVFYMRAGVQYESREEWGMSHFLEHILMRSTERYANLYDLSREVEGIGGQTSAYSTRDLVGYWVKVPAGAEKKALEVLNQILFSAKIKQEFIAAERLIVEQERIRERSNASLFTSLAVESMLLQPKPVSRHPLGEESMLMTLTPQTLNAFLAKAYNRSNMLVAASGNLSEEIEDLVAQSIAPARVGPPAQAQSFTLPLSYGPERVVLLPGAQKEQVFLALGWRFPVANRRELIAWRVLNTMLGAGYTSLLNQTLRERESLTYVCNTAVSYYADYFSQDNCEKVQSAPASGAGIFKVHMGLNKRNLSAALKYLHRIVGEVGRGIVAQGSFEEAKVRHAAGVVYRHENPLEVARLLGHTLGREHCVFSLSEYLETLEAITLEEVSGLVREYLAPQQALLLMQTGAQDLQNITVFG